MADVDRRPGSRRKRLGPATARLAGRLRCLGSGSVGGSMPGWSAGARPSSAGHHVFLPARRNLYSERVRARLDLKTQSYVGSAYT